MISGDMIWGERFSGQFKKVSRENHPGDTIIPIGNSIIGGGNFILIGGPCSIESREQITEIAEAVKELGCDAFRGGAFKPRTSPYTFQGLGKEGIELLEEVKKLTELPVVTEITDKSMIPLFKDIDIIQVGAKNMQNFELLKALGRTEKTILLKRGPAATLEEFLLSAEYIMSEGNLKVILCERGIRTFNNYTRYTLDVSSVPALKAMTHLPVIVDPSHAAGIRSLVNPLAMAAVAAGADGIMVEVHNCPEKAASDGKQAITCEEFNKMSQKLRALHDFVIKK